ncbi:DoxX family protein [Rhizobium rhizogenes]|uniref:DoxX family protein n=1 Tax=Rhizobium rhizogenes TaxID=359 RepID=UPI003ECDBAAA
MGKFKWSLILPWIVGVFFVAGGLGNIFASNTILDDYQRWGYPGWFHYVTGIVELAAATLILLRPTRLLGLALAAAVMLAATATVLGHGEYSHAIAPAIALGLVLLTGWTTWRAGLAASP